MPNGLPSESWCPAPWCGYVVNNDGTTAVCPIGPKVDVGMDGRLDRSQLDAIRVSMLRGDRLPACDKCWFHERSGAKSLRQAYIEIWKDKLDMSKVSNLGYDPRFYFDISMSNKCNQKCRICGPSNSTGWFKDAERLDALPWTHVAGERTIRNSGFMIDGMLMMMARSPLPLEIELKGGEPLYLAETRELLQRMVGQGLNDRTHVLKVLTNGTVTDDAVLELLGRFPRIDVSISVDAVGKLHSYTRSPTMSWDDCRRSWTRLAGLPNIRHLGIANTVYIYNVFDQSRLAEWARSEFGITDRMSNAILSKPSYLNIKIMPDDLKAAALEALGSHPMRSSMDGIAALLTEDVTERDVLPKNSRKQTASAMEVTLRLMRLRERFRSFTEALDGIRGERITDLVPELSAMMS